MRPQLVIFYLLLPVICLGDYPADTPTFHVIKRVWDGRVLFWTLDMDVTEVMDCLDAVTKDTRLRSKATPRRVKQLRFPGQPNPSCALWFGIC